jgi:ribosome-associated toxin RatA of RatAB toxin-antitoxin module
MGAHEAQHSAVIAAAPETCFDALCEFETYPEWQSAVKRCEVLEREADGSLVVETLIDLRVREIRYVLRYQFERPHRMWWEYLDGDARDIAGDFELEDLRDGTTRATYRLAVDPGRFVPGPLKRLIAEQGTRGAVEDLRSRVEPAG